jgi:hypothetical protein
VNDGGDHKTDQSASEGGRCYALHAAIVRLPAADACRGSAEEVPLSAVAE